MIIAQLSCLHLSWSSSPGWCSYSFSHLQPPPCALHFTYEAKLLHCCVFAGAPLLLIERQHHMERASGNPTDGGLKTSQKTLALFKSSPDEDQPFDITLILIAKLGGFLKKGKSPFIQRFLQMGIRLLNRLWVTWHPCACFRTLTPDPHGGSPLTRHADRSHCGSSWCQTLASSALVPHRI